MVNDAQSTIFLLSYQGSLGLFKPAPSGEQRVKGTPGGGPVLDGPELLTYVRRFR
jgi:hypothetical protein